MKILLFSTPSDSKITSWLYPLGIAYLTSVLKNMATVKSYNFFNEDWKDCKKKILNIIKKENPEVIGLSFLAINRITAFKIAKIVKKINPKIKVIAGGIHASSLYEQILTKYPIDVVVIGEGEKTLPELINAFENFTDLKKIKGIAFKSKHGIHATEPREPIKELDEIPFPAHEAFSDIIKNKNIACMITSRGCPARCQFCSTSNYWGQHWRYRSAKNVVDEIEMLVNKFKKLKQINFYDDTFTLNNQRVIDICNEILKRNIKINWLCPARAHPITEEMLSLMKKAGCIRITYGVESGSAAMLERIGKKITLEQIENAIRLTRKVGIPFGIFLLVGVKGESDETIEETVQFIRKNKIDNVESVAMLELYPNTESYKIAKEEGFINDEFWISEEPVKIYTKHLSEEKLRDMANKIIIQSIKNKGKAKLMTYFLKMMVLHPRKVYTAAFKRKYIKTMINTLR